MINVDTCLHAPQEQGDMPALLPIGQEVENHERCQSCDCAFVLICCNACLTPGLADSAEDVMEHQFGRASPLDGITPLRSLLGFLLRAYVQCLCQSLNI